MLEPGVERCARAYVIVCVCFDEQSRAKDGKLCSSSASCSVLQRSCLGLGWRGGQRAGPILPPGSPSIWVTCLPCGYLPVQTTSGQSRRGNYVLGVDLEYLLPVPTASWT